MKLKLTITLIAAALTTAVCGAAADAKPNWTKHCASCHGADGKGETRMGKRAGAKDYTDAKVQAEMKDDKAAKAIKEGITEKGKEVMKPFGDKLSDDEIKDLVAYMRTFKK